MSEDICDHETKSCPLLDEYCLAMKERKANFEYQKGIIKLYQEYFEPTLAKFFGYIISIITLTAVLNGTAFTLLFSTQNTQYYIAMMYFLFGMFLIFGFAVIALFTHLHLLCVPAKSKLIQKEGLENAFRIYEKTISKLYILLATFILMEFILFSSGALEAKNVFLHGV